MSQVEKALAFIRERGDVRSNQVADWLGCTPDNAHELLQPAVLRGELVSCDLTVNGFQLKQYRVAAAAGGPIKQFNPLQASRPGERTAPVFPRQLDEPQRPQHDQPKEETPMSIAEQIIAALKKHGPQSTQELAKHVKNENLSTIVGQLARAGKLAATPGVKNRIYGLLDQKLPAPAAAPAAREEKKPRGGAFRPSIDVDGIVLLTGAARPGELTGPEARMLQGFLERVSGALG